ncbi:glycosyltransferase family 4 protein [Acidicapsa acidisoli]|uniref:glycosyltransferase family 4 protein n=1 Tax=Acidicapsa acidisoli TaxID=1615681 RepID=UPI0021DFECBB|nr:glycosyltransferase family 4 protein [Acidicapsa acidisoli]
MDNHTKNARLKVAIGHPRLGRGGSEARVMWLIEALKRDSEVTVVTTGGWDLAALNGYYGTCVREDEVKVRIAPVPRLFRNLSVAALRGACYQHFARQIAEEYDARVSAYNPTDWGLPAVHFIADFSWDRELRERLDPPSPGLIYRDSVVRKAYLGIASAYGSPSGRDVLRDDPVIANSLWTANLMKESFGVDCAAIVYPSVWTEFPDIPWEQKEDAFVMIGRIAPEKRLELAIAVLEAVRLRGHVIRLHLCGQIGDDLYGRRIARLCQEHADWVVPEGKVSGSRKAQILASCRFGIQTRAAESFGISVAEMVKAGAIVFAPNDGGQTEVVDHSDLLFADMADAVEKISALLSSPEKQVALRAHLAQRSEIFSSAKFMEAARQQVKRTPFHPHPAQSCRHRQKVVIGHPRLGFGGSESTVMWLIEALKRDYEVTVVTTGGWDLAALNNYYGTRIREDEVKIRLAPVPFLIRHLSAAALRGACYQRFARQIAGEYDLRISAYNPTDWGLPAVHFVADFSWHRELRKRLHPPSPGWIYRESPVRRAYLGIASTYGRPSGRDAFRDDPVIANSRWTASLLKQFCEVECRAVVYPSVWTEFPHVPWDMKEQAFVMIGRIVPQKQVERAIAILETIRQRGHAIRLYLCGEIENDSYGRRIAQLCKERADWIVLEGRVSGNRKAQILANCRYGIQTCAAESFGISVAEMVKAGAIVFASSDGGQTEILRHSGLLFSCVDEAVEKIQAVLEKPSLQSAMRAHLAAQAQRFSSTTFMREARACIENKPAVDYTISYNAISQRP